MALLLFILGASCARSKICDVCNRRRKATDELLFKYWPALQRLALWDSLDSDDDACSAGLSMPQRVVLMTRAVSDSHIFSILTFISCLSLSFISSFLCYLVCRPFTEYPQLALHALCWIWDTYTYRNSHPTARAARFGGLGMQGGKAWVRRAYSVALNGLWNGVVSVLWNWLLALSRF